MATTQNLTKETEATGLEKWEPIMAEWRKSGLSAAEWVSQRTDITYQQFNHARRNWFPQDMARTGPIDKQTDWSALTIELPSTTMDLFIKDCRIEVTSGFDQELLLELLEVIRNED